MVLRDILPISFFRWCEGSFIAAFIQHSRWSFAVIETVHILALAVLLGTFLIVDLRLLGFGMRQDPLADIAKQFELYGWAAFAIMVITGILMYLSEAIRLANSTPFFFKMLLLCSAGAFHLTVFRKVTTSAGRENPRLAKLTASLSLICWLGVALAGRAIAFLSK